jgi:hypothetical protein
VLADGRHQRPVFQNRYAHPATAGTTVDRGRVQPSVFDRSPRHSHRDALLRIHGHGFARSDSEETGIEIRCPGEETTGVTDRRPAFVVMQGEQLIDRPVPVTWKRTDQLFRFGERGPEFRQALDSAGYLDRHSDNDDRIVASRVHICHGEPNVESDSTGSG